MENGGEGEGGGGDDYTKDGSVDLRGNPARVTNMAPFMPFRVILVIE